MHFGKFSATVDNASVLTVIELKSAGFDVFIVISSLVKGVADGSKDVVVVIWVVVGGCVVDVVVVFT